MNPVTLAIAAFITAAIGTLGGLGGAILLVPILVLSGMEAKYAAPLGLVSVAAGSLAAAPHQLKAQVVNQRLGVATEIAASSAALIGALVSGLLGHALLSVLLGVVALVAAFAGARARVATAGRCCRAGSIRRAAPRRLRARTRASRARRCVWSPQSVATDRWSCRALPVSRFA